jgi:hypothetical protein
LIAREVLLTNVSLITIRDKFINDRTQLLLQPFTVIAFPFEFLIIFKMCLSLELITKFSESLSTLKPQFNNIFKILSLPWFKYLHDKYTGFESLFTKDLELKRNLLWFTIFKTKSVLRSLTANHNGVWQKKSVWFTSILDSWSKSWKIFESPENFNFHWKLYLLYTW